MRRNGSAVPSPRLPLPEMARLLFDEPLAEQLCEALVDVFPASNVSCADPPAKLVGSGPAASGQSAQGSCRRSRAGCRTMTSCMRCILVACLLGAISLPMAPANATSGVMCDGIAPRDFRCQDSFVIESGSLALEVSLGDGPGFGFQGVLRATFRGRSGSESIECASGPFGSPAACQFSAPVRWHAGETVSLLVRVFGLGPWLVRGETG